MTGQPQPQPAEARAIPRGQCATCGCDIALTVAGTARKHGPAANPCAGVGRPAVGMGPITTRPAAAPPEAPDPPSRCRCGHTRACHPAATEGHCTTPGCGCAAFRAQGAAT